MTWPIVPLGEVADTALGKMLDRGKPKGHAHVPYLRNVNVQWDQIDTSDLLTMELADSERERFEVKPGDLLVCEGGEIGRSAIWPGRAEYIAYQKALHRVRSRGGVDLKYLRYLLEHRTYDGTLSRLATGSTIAHLPQQQLRRVPVPLAPLRDQRRIVELLEDHFSRLDAAGMYLDSANRRAEQLLGAELENLWSLDSPRIPVDSLGRVVTGSTPPAKLGQVFGEGRWFLTPGDLGYGNQVQSSVRALSTLGMASAREASAGSVLVVCIGATIGKVGWVDRATSFNQQINAVIPDSNLVMSEFLSYAMAAPAFQRLLHAHASSTTMPILNKSKFSALPVACPPLAQQGAAVSRIRALRETLDRLQEQIRTGRQRSVAIRRSLLSAAFSGLLTGQPSAQQPTGIRSD